VDSIYAQEGLGEHFDIEIIVVDDASSDSTTGVVRRYSGVRYIRQPERWGVSAARNAGLRASTGCYISFLDDDDVWLPNKLRVQVPQLEAHTDVGVVYGQSLIRRGAGERLSPEVRRAPSGWVFPAMLMDNFISNHATELIRREAFDKAGYFDESLDSAEDYDMSLRIAFHFPFLFVPGAVYVYNLSPHGLWLSRAASGLAATDHARAVEKALEMLPESARYAEVKREARARAALGVVYPFVELGDLTQAWAKLIAALRACPWLLGYDWARETVSWLTFKRARVAESPVAATRDLCAQIKAATANRSIREEWWACKTAAMVWGRMAIFLAFSPPIRDRVDELCVGLYKRVKQTTMKK
jgi:glycosyltransferase involved in cell wall biosynthesis